MSWQAYNRLSTNILPIKDRKDGSGGIKAGRVETAVKAESFFR
jgi:hypothetical protein